MGKFFLPGWTVRKGEGVDHGIHLHPDFFSDLENYNKGGNQMSKNETLIEKNLIETSVDLRAKLEQVAEECGELTKACMKLIRAIGNGNPCNVSKEEAINSVVEEISDVEVATYYLKLMLQEHVNYDIWDRLDNIAEEKVERWQQRVADAQSDSCEGKDYCDISTSF